MGYGFKFFFGEQGKFHVMF